MLKPNEEIISKLSEWIKSESTKNPYSDLTVTITVHDGKFTKLQRLVTTKSREVIN